MRKSPSLILPILSLGLILSSGLPIISNTHFSSVKADEQAVQTYRYNEMVGLCSSISGNDITDVNSDPNQLIDYGFRHGDVATGIIEKFSQFGDNRLGISDSGYASFLNWKMETGHGDGGIIKLTANKKIILNISRGKLGNDWRDDIVLSIYKDSTLVSSKKLSDSGSTTEDFTFSTILDEGETLYWQIRAETTERRLIAMDSGGADWNTLPTFVATEYIEYPSANVTMSNLKDGYKGTLTTHASNLFNYQFGYGSIENKTFNNATKIGDDITFSYSSIKNDGMHLAPNENIYLKLTALKTLKIVPNWNEDSNYNNISISYYAEIGSKTKLVYSDSNFNLEELANLMRTLVLHQSKTAYITIKNTSTSNITANLLDGIYFEEVPSNTTLESEYPIYSATDFTNKTSITHKELSFETAKLKCAPIKLKDGQLSLLTGTVGEDKKEDINKFDTIKYDDGVYLYNQSGFPTFTLAGPAGTFNSDDQAVVQDYRLQTSYAEAVIYKFEAKVNTKLVVTHPATDGGWVGGSIYIEALQNNQKLTKSISKKPVDNAVNAENTFAATYHLKAGDTAFYVFGSDMALRRNLNIAPVFTTYSDQYNDSIRESLFGPTVVEATLYQTVTDTLNNEFEPVTYEDSLTITLGHGSVEDIKLFTASAGSGKGGADDAIFVGNGGDSDAGFQRWQFHAGLDNDNAIMKYQTHKDTELVITHIPIVSYYGPGSSMKYYIVDTDGFIEFKEERFLASDTPADFYGYTINLKAEQSLVMEFTANDPSGYAVASIEWVATSNPKNYNETLTNDFTDARNLQAYKDNLSNQLDEYVATLRESDYSKANYSKIEELVATFKTSIKQIDNEADVLDLYNETVSKIDDILTLFEEEELLIQTRESAIAEAEAYINERKSSYTKKEWQVVQEEFDSFKLLVNMETSITQINILLTSFKTTIDGLPATKAQETAIIIGVTCGSVATIGGLLAIVVAVTKKKKGK